ncbi:MAG: ribonuclease H-like domain-containing protein [archaeon GB-1845-036]|nr:ribonuclease H-like domain-containing protein [Candidatus Culexmicrobium thermophilum]
MNLGKILFLDVESTSLTAESGFIVGAGIMDENGKWIHEFVDDNIAENEGKILRRILERISEADTIITWYGENFDIPMIISRSLVNGIDPKIILEKRHIDLYKYARRLLRLNDYSLDRVAKFFGISKRSELKGSDMPPLYMRAISGDGEALKKIMEHCYDDLKALREIFIFMRSMIEHLEGEVDG